MTKLNDEKQIDEREDVEYIYDEKVISSQDCTGLIPAMPGNDYESESYQDLYNIPKQGNIKDIGNEILKDKALNDKK